MLVVVGGFTPVVKDFWMRRPAGSYFKLTVPPLFGGVTAGQAVLEIPGVAGRARGIRFACCVAVVVVGDECLQLIQNVFLDST